MKSSLDNHGKKCNITVVAEFLRSSYLRSQGSCAHTHTYACIWTNIVPI